MVIQIIVIKSPKIKLNLVDKIDEVDDKVEKGE